jgi:hypothetical protein
MSSIESRSNSAEETKRVDDSAQVEISAAHNIDFITYYEGNAGRLVVDPEYVVQRLYPPLTDSLDYREAKVEFGDAVANTLKLSPDGSKILWPQPSDDPEDPQNVCFKLNLLKGSTDPFTVV